MPCSREKRDLLPEINPVTFCYHALKGVRTEFNAQTAKLNEKTLAFNESAYQLLSAASIPSLEAAAMDCERHITAIEHQFRTLEDLVAQVDIDAFALLLRDDVGGRHLTEEQRRRELMQSKASIELWLVVRKTKSPTATMRRWVARETKIIKDDYETPWGMKGEAYLSEEAESGSEEGVINRDELKLSSTEKPVDIDHKYMTRFLDNEFRQMNLEKDRQ